MGRSLSKANFFVPSGMVTPKRPIVRAVKRLDHVEIATKGGETIISWDSREQLLARLEGAHVSEAKGIAQAFKAIGDSRPVVLHTEELGDRDVISDWFDHAPEEVPRPRRAQGRSGLRPLPPWVSRATSTAGGRRAGDARRGLLSGAPLNRAKATCKKRRRCRRVGSDTHRAPGPGLPPRFLADTADGPVIECRSSAHLI